MPAMDRTGPLGTGPVGRGRGNCQRRCRRGFGAGRFADAPETLTREAEIATLENDLAEIQARIDALKAR